MFNTALKVLFCPIDGISRSIPCGIPRISQVDTERTFRGIDYRRCCSTTFILQPYRIKVVSRTYIDMIWSQTCFSFDAHDKTLPVQVYWPQHSPQRGHPQWTVCIAYMGVWQTRDFVYSVGYPALEAKNGKRLLSRCSVIVAKTGPLYSKGVPCWYGALHRMSCAGQRPAYLAWPKRKGQTTERKKA